MYDVRSHGAHANSTTPNVHRHFSTTKCQTPISPLYDGSDACIWTPEWRSGEGGGGGQDTDRGFHRISKETRGGIGIGSVVRRRTGVWLGFLAWIS